MYLTRAINLAMSVHGTTVETRSGGVFLSGMSMGGRIIAAAHILVVAAVILIGINYGLLYLVRPHDTHLDHLEHVRGLEGYTLESQASGKFLFERERPTRVMVFRRREATTNASDGAPRIILFFKQFGPDRDIKYLSEFKRMKCGLPPFRGDGGQPETIEVKLASRRLDFVIERTTAKGPSRHELRYGRPHGDYELLLLEETESFGDRWHKTRYFEQRIEREDGSVTHAALPRKTMSQNCY